MKKTITFIFLITSCKFYCQVNTPVTDSCTCITSITVPNSKEIELKLPTIGQGLSRSTQGIMLFTNETEFKNYYKRYFRQSMIDSVLMTSNVNFNTSNLILFWKWLGGRIDSKVAISKCSEDFLQLNLILLSLEMDLVNEPTIKYVTIPKYINSIKHIKACLTSKEEH